MNHYFDIVMGGENITIFTRHVLILKEVRNGTEIYVREIEDPFFTVKSKYEVISAMGLVNFDADFDD